MTHNSSSHSNPQNQNHLSGKNFSRKNLKGRKFIGKDLRGASFFEAELKDANFSRAKLRGADFRNSNLRGADFTGADFVSPSSNSGSSLHRADFSCAKIQGAKFTRALLNEVNFAESQAGLGSGGYFLLILLTFLACLTSAFPAAIAITLVFFRSTHQKPSVLTLLFIGIGSILITALVRTALLYTPLGYNAVFIHITFGILMILMVLIGEIIAIAITDSKDDFGGVFWATVAFLVVLSWSIYSVYSSTSEENPNNWLATFLEILFGDINAKVYGTWTSGVLGAAIGAFFGCWFAQSAIIGKRFTWIWKLYVKVTVQGGTLFDKADLTKANFDSAILRGSSFENARIVGTHWYNAEYLECASVGNSYLKYPKIRQLFSGEILEDFNFDRLNLEGIDLEGAELAGASFIGTNLSHANLRDANLIDADLKQANLDSTNLTGARLTGIWLEGWTYDDKTIFRDVECDYVYREKLPGRRGLWRREPLDKDFKRGDFEKIYTKDNSAIQLFIRNDNNRRALDAAFSQLVQDNPGITPDSFDEVRRIGDDVLVTIKVPNHTDKSNVEQQFYQQVEQENSMDSSPQESDNQSSFEFVLSLLREIREMMNNNITNISTGSGNIVNSNSGAYVQGDYISMSQDLTHAASQIQDLLDQLRQHGVVENAAQKQVATDLASEAKKDPNVREKLQKWGESLASTTVSDVVKGIVKLACKSAGIPL